MPGQPRSLPSLVSLALLLSIASVAACSDSTSSPERAASSSGQPTIDAPEGARGAADPQQDASTEPSDTYVPEAEPAAVITGPFDLADVSILFPLPTTDKLLKASTPAAHGALLPQALFASFPSLAGAGVGVGPDAQKGSGAFYDDLRVVALRVDPCFPSLAVPNGQCRPQVRLTLQPITFSNGGGSAADVAVHLLYDLPAGDVAKLVAQISTLKAASKAATTGAALDVHPALSSEGVDGAFGSGLRAALLAKIGAARLTRVALMGMPQDQAQWRFFGFDIVAGAAKPIDIAKAGVTAQDVHVTFGAGGDVFVDQPVQTDDELDGFFSLTSSAPLVDRQAAQGAALRIENPKLRDAEGVSCAGCHLAGSLRQRAETHWGMSSVGNPDAFTSASFDLSAKGQVVGDATALRAFGYRQTKTIISQRVINESAAVAAYLNAGQ